MKSTPILPQTPAPCSAPPCPPELLLTQVQMAQRLGISRRTLATWVTNQIVPMIKVRGYCRFDVAKVLAALERHERPAATSPESARGINR